MAINTYDIGDQVKVTGTFTNAAGAALDPTTVKVTVRDPSENEATYVYGVDAEVIRASAGVYYMEVDADEEGTWFYAWDSYGTGKAAGEYQFYVIERMTDRP